MSHRIPILVVATLQLASCTNNGWPDVTASESCPGCSPEMQLHLDEVAGATGFADASGFGHAGSCAGASCPVAGASGVLHSAIHLDGSTQFVTVAGAADLRPTTAVAAGAFVNITTQPGTGPAMTGYELISMGDSYVVEIRPGGGVRFFIYDGANWDVVDSTGVNVVDGHFHHVLGQKTATALEVYVDGRLAGSRSFTGTIAYTLGGDLLIGKHGNGGARYFNGVVDEVVMYPRSLSASEIAALASAGSGGGTCTPPSTYAAYTGTDVKASSPPALGPANTSIVDATFGSTILRVTDANTASGESFMPEDTGLYRTWNANSTAIKLSDVHGFGYWLEFDPHAGKVGDGSAHPVPHELPFSWTWEWSAVDPNIIYFMQGNQFGRYNKSTGTSQLFGGTPNGAPLASHVAVVGADDWVCAAAGYHAGTTEQCYQNECSALYCVQPSNPANAKYIDAYNRTVNGAPQPDPSWPTSAAGQVLGVHSLAGGTASTWLYVTFHQQSWGGNGDSIMNLSTNTWSVLKDQNHGGDIYWAGHDAIGYDKFLNMGSANKLNDGRGSVARDPSALDDATRFVFFEQPTTAMSPLDDWSDDGHMSWHNSLGNHDAPVLLSTYSVQDSTIYAWENEIIMAAVDGSNTVWRFAHTYPTHNPYGFEYSAFADISPDGRWAVFSSDWGASLGASPAGTGFGAVRIDTFIVQLAPACP